MRCGDQVVTTDHLPFRAIGRSDNPPGIFRTINVILKLIKFGFVLPQLFAGLRIRNQLVGYELKLDLAGIWVILDKVSLKRLGL